MTKKLTTIEYKQWIFEHRPEFYVVEEYQGDNVKILHQHIATSLAWFCSPSKFKSGTSHPSLSRRSVMNRTHEEYATWVKEHRPDFEVVEQYKNVKTKIKHQHIETGISWNCAPDKFMSGILPTQLTNCERWDKNKYTKFLVDNNIPVQLIGEFKTQITRTLHQCMIRNVLFWITPQRIIRNRAFVYREKIHDTESYKHWLLINRPELIITESYQTSHTKINHMHVETMDCWLVNPNNVINGHRHPCQSLTSGSHKCVDWLNHISAHEQCKIKHILNGGECHIEGVGKVDGFCEETNTVYEFHGDFWHGNPNVFIPTDINPVLKIEFGQLFEKTQKRDQTIKDKGYNLEVIWEADFNAQ